MPRRADSSRQMRDVKRKLEDAKDRAHEMKDMAKDMIYENPFASMAVAAAVGAVLAISVASIIRQRKSFLSNVMDLF